MTSPEEFQSNLRQDALSSPETKLLQRMLVNQYREMARTKSVPPLREVGCRVYSQFEEDGMLLCLFAVMGMGKKRFIDVGSGDCISSNCANLAINHGWFGLFIDGDENSLRRGYDYYINHPDTRLAPPKFLPARIERENINQLISHTDMLGDLDFMSIDIDGNDIWIWDALECVSPRVMMVESRVQYGMRNIAVPYDRNFQYPGIHENYAGASPMAFATLAKRKGYRLVGANAYGFNLIFVRGNEGIEHFPEVSVESILDHPMQPGWDAEYQQVQHLKFVAL